MSRRWLFNTTLRKGLTLAVTLALALLACLAVVEAQQAGKLARVGVQYFGSRQTGLGGERYAAFVEGMYDQVLARIGYKRPPRPRAPAPPTWFIFGPQRQFFSMSLFQAKLDGVNRRYDRHAPGLNHLAFHVPSRQDAEDLYAHLCGIGAKILRAPAEYPYTPGYYALFFADPDGMKLEVVCEPAQDVARDVCPACGELGQTRSKVCMGCGLSFEPAAG